MQKYDVIIVGGGLAGLTAACLFGHYGFSTLCLDAQRREDALAPSKDTRTTAMSYGSHLLLKATGIWDKIEAQICPINRIDIMDGATPTLLPFLNEEVGGKAFGFIVDNQVLRRALFDRAGEIETLDHHCGEAFETLEQREGSVAINNAYQGTLVIGADGRGSKTREALGISVTKKEYNQSASVFIARHEHPHNNLAVEHFRENGPFAILPMLDGEHGHRSCVVWSDHDENMMRDPDIFLRAVQERFPRSYGEVMEVGTVSKWPLRYQHADTYVATRCALIAEAAHVMHPIAGQGLNMSLRDVAAIVELCVEARASGKDIGDKEVLERYEAWRRKDNHAMVRATDCLNMLFSNKIPAVRSMRNLGLEIVRKTPFFKNIFMTQAMGQVGSLPKLIKGEDLAA